MLLHKLVDQIDQKPEASMHKEADTLALFFLPSFLPRSEATAHVDLYEFGRGGGRPE